MGPAQQVFDVNELLEIIIWQVEAHQVRWLMKLSRHCLLLTPQQIPELKLLGKSWYVCEEGDAPGTGYACHFLNDWRDVVDDG